MNDTEMNELPDIAAVIFDMDGLMFNTEDLYDVVGDMVLQKRGHRFTRELKHKMMGLQAQAAFEVMRAECQLSESVDQLHAECNEIFVDLLPREIRKMPGLDMVLDEVETAGLPKAIATSSHRSFAELALGVFELLPRFEFLLTAEDVTHGKPAPDIYLLGCKKLGVEPDQTLVLEDSLNGTLAARAAGTFLIAVPTHHSAHLDYSHANFQVERLDDPKVLNMIKRHGL